VSQDDVEGEQPASSPTTASHRSVVRDDARSDEIEALGEEQDTEGFSSYSRVGHYVPDAPLDAHDRMTVGEEK